MKRSQFNLLIPEADDSIIGYNTLSGSLIRINKKLLKAMNNGIAELAKLPELSNELLDLGFLVNKEKDELQAYNELHAQWKTGKEKVEFNILLTYDCNFECPYCYQGRGEVGENIHGNKDMAPETINAFKTFVKNTSIETQAKNVELILYGGEPFLKPLECREITDDISQWCNEHGKDFHLYVLTNGVLVTPEIVKWLSKYKTRIQIPVDGDKNMHDSYRYDKDKKTRSFETIVKTLMLLQENNIETHIRISLTDETYPTIENLLDQLLERGISKVYPDFCYITAFTDACDEFKTHTLSDFKLFRIMPELWKLAHDKGFPLDIRPTVQPLPCSSIADGSFIVDPYSNVYKCWEQVGLKEHCIGSIDDTGKLIKTEVYNKVLERNPTVFEPCASHNILPACGGGCVCKAYWKKGSYQAPGCGSEKYLMIDKITSYLYSINGKKLPNMQVADYYLETIERNQAPKMSHCYVLV